MKLLYSAVSLGVVATAMENSELPDPPMCITDCVGFDVIATGQVDDCAVSSKWGDSDCMSDCGLEDYAVLTYINGIFCRRLNEDGSYGGSYLSYGTEEVVTEDSPTESCVDVGFDGTSCEVYILAHGGFEDGHAQGGAVLCEGNDADDYCDCSGDCGSSFCACADAIACCEGEFEGDTPEPTAYPTAVPEGRRRLDHGGDGEICQVMASNMETTYESFVTTLADLYTACPQLCGICDGAPEDIPVLTCTDDYPGFKDRYNETCNDWYGYSCKDENLAGYMSVEESAELRANCPNSCRLSIESSEGDCVSLCDACNTAGSSSCFVDGEYSEDNCTFEANASLEIGECAVCHPISCADNPTFTDALGYSCTGWVGYDCFSEENLEDAGGWYTEDQWLDLLVNCAGSCLVTPDLAAQYDELSCQTGEWVDVTPTPEPTVYPTVPPEEPTEEPTEESTDAAEEVLTSEESTPLVVSVELEATFTKVLETTEVATATDAIETSMAENWKLDRDYVEATMTLGTVGRRHLLNIVYEIVIVITIPAEDLEGADVELLASVDAMTAAETSADFFEAVAANIASNTVIIAINGGTEPTSTVVTVTIVEAVLVVNDDPTEAPTETTPSSASIVSPAFGLLVSAVCVVASL